MANWALDYDGSDDYVTFPIVITSAMWRRTADFTFEGWGRTDAFTTIAQALIALGQNAEDWSIGLISLRQIEIASVTRNRLAIHVRDNTNRQSDRWITDNSVDLVDGTIYYLVVTQSGSTIKMFIDGTEVGVVHDQVGNISGTLNNTKTLLGCRSVSVTENWVNDLDGFIDEVRISDIARTPSEISDIWAAKEEFVVDGNTIALWHKNEGTGSTINDETANNHDGTITGASWVAGYPFPLPTPVTDGDLIGIGIIRKS